MNNRGPIAGSRLAAVALALLSSDLLANDDAQVTHFTDSGGERVPTNTVAPIYPAIARRDRIEGDVKVCFDVDREGRPYRIAVRTSTNRVFEKPSLRAVRASRFRALAAGEESSGIKTCRTFRFRLEPLAADEESQP